MSGTTRGHEVGNSYTQNDTYQVFSTQLKENEDTSHNCSLAPLSARCS
jgi:hypothetical protein